MSEPRFLPPKGKTEIHLATTEGGHSCVIYAIDPTDKKKGTIIPDRFRKLAIAENCGIVGIDDGEDESNTSPSKNDLIVAAITKIMERQIPEELEGDGRPKVAVVKKEAGFNVTKAQFEAAWPLYVEGLGAEDEGED
ncbi:hypothetical protein [Aquipseudomonas campi]